MLVHKFRFKGGQKRGDGERSRFFLFLKNFNKEISLSEALSYSFAEKTGKDTYKTEVSEWKLFIETASFGGKRACGALHISLSNEEKTLMIFLKTATGEPFIFEAKGKIINKEVFTEPSDFFNEVVGIITDHPHGGREGTKPRLIRR